MGSKKAGKKAAKKDLILKVTHVFDGLNDDVINLHIRGSDRCAGSMLTKSKTGSVPPTRKYGFKGNIIEEATRQKIVLTPFLKKNR